MKTLLLFHREELTYLFSSIALNVKDKLHVINVAYSPKEACMLQKAGIHVNYVYSSLLAEALDSQNGINQQTLEQIDNIIIKNSKGRFTLNGALQSDRGFSLLSNNEALVLAQANYAVFSKIFSYSHVDVLLHEPCSLFFNHLAAIMCLNQGGIYLSHSTVFSENNFTPSYINIINDDYTCPEVVHNFNYFLSHTDEIDYRRCEEFLLRFRSSFDVFQKSLQDKRSYWEYFVKGIKCMLYQRLNKNRFDRLKNNIDYWLSNQNVFGTRLKNIFEYKRYRIAFESPRANEDYYYYSFHLEPEAVVLYLSDGLYTNQVKLIENIAASLPPGCYLYVKDHPHEFAYRDVSDYIRLKKIPNIRLISSNIPGKLLIKDSLGVFTINGTAGFEALMLRKQVYCFGKSYYTECPHVCFIKDIRDLRPLVYKKKHTSYNDDEIFMAFVNAYLESLHPGMVDFFMGLSQKYQGDLESNARIISKDLLSFIMHYGIDINESRQHCSKIETANSSIS